MWAEFATDPDVQCLAFEDQRHYVVVLCLKCSGVLDKDYPTAEHRERVVRRGLGLDPMTAAEARRRLMEAGLVDENWQPLGWDKRQRRGDHDATAAERQRRRREKQRHASVTRDITATSRPPDTESELDTDPEGNNPPVSPPSPPASGKRGSQPAARARRLPDDFELTDERRRVAEAERLDPARTFAKFCDYWRAASGQKARKHDWDATWRNWCRTEADRSRGSQPAARGSPAEQSRFTGLGSKDYGDTDPGRFGS